MITEQTKSYSKKQIYKTLHPWVRQWFDETFEDFTPAQKKSIVDIHKGNNILVSSPTGSGKTLTAFLSILSELTTLSQKGKLEDKVYCIYISPLKALDNDIEKNLEEPLKGIEKIAGKDLGIRKAVRTGDTTQYQRQKMLKKPPHILITTPETLSILLVAPKFREKLSNVKYVIIDEIHSLAENKRGVHMVDAGKSEIILHQRYQKNAEALQERYPYTADIYFAISDNYKRKAEYERKRAEDEW